VLNAAANKSKDALMTSANYAPHPRPCSKLLGEVREENLPKIQPSLKVRVQSEYQINPVISSLRKPRQ
jgi:hypothetical protein